MTYCLGTMHKRTKKLASTWNELTLGSMLNCRSIEPVRGLVEAAEEQAAPMLHGIEQLLQLYAKDIHNAAIDEVAIVGGVQWR